MVHRAMPTRSTASYGSLLSARPARYGLRVSDRVALCPTCETARRIDLNDTLYTHLSAETRTMGSEKTWIDCQGSQGRALVASVIDFAAPAVPDELLMSIRATQGENFRRIIRLEGLIQLHKDYTLTTDEVVAGRNRQRIQEHLDAIKMMHAENELLRALLAA